jgi:methylmalonyl-CoA/ethylmalonyl-CoA epimerase
LPEDLFRAQLGEPHHYAYVVDDIEATVNRLVDQLGAGPFFLIENVPLENVLSRGEPAEFVHNSAFGSCDGSAIELIEVVSLAPERVERGFSGARPRIQHVGYVVPATEVADLRSSLDERGVTQYLSSQLGEVETTLHDASATLGHDIEIHVDNQGLHDFFSNGERRCRGLGWLGTAAPGRELIAAFKPSEHFSGWFEDARWGRAAGVSSGACPRVRSRNQQ